jgi:hypothetical protein
MKVVNSSPISSFGGLNFVIKELENKKLGILLNEFLPSLPSQSQYSWRDIIFSYWSIFFCGGDCAEDINNNFKSSFSNNPLLNVPSADRILNRMKHLSEPLQLFDTVRGNVTHEFNCNNMLSKLSLKVIKKLSLLDKTNLTLDYDNTLIFTNKADTKKTYKKHNGYAPGVGLIGANVVYVENRNGNSDAQTLQHDTLKRMFNLLENERIEIDCFRADAASYQLLTLSVACENTNHLYVRARRDAAVMNAIASIENWEKTNEKEIYRGTIDFIPFVKRAKDHKLTHLLKPYRLVVTKIPNKDGQMNIFTGEACRYQAIITNDWEKSNDQIVHFYNQRGAIEKEFDVLKNDFGWNSLPFSKLKFNTVHLILTAICKNIYNYIINVFSVRYQNLSSKDRIKKFIFRFICIPAKWIKSGRMYKLRIYGNLYFKT